MSFLLPMTVTVLSFLLIDFFVPNIRRYSDFERARRVRSRMYWTAWGITTVSWIWWIYA